MRPITPLLVCAVAVVAYSAPALGEPDVFNRTPEQIKKDVLLANQFKQSCRGIDDPKGITDMCMARLDTFESLNTITTVNNVTTSPWGVCPPNGVSLDDQIRAVNANSYKYPSTMGATYVMIMSLHDVWPCPLPSQKAPPG